MSNEICRCGHTKEDHAFNGDMAICGECKCAVFHAVPGFPNPKSQSSDWECADCGQRYGTSPAHGCSECGWCPCDSMFGNIKTLLLQERADRRLGELEERLCDVLRGEGCTCERPLLGYRPGVGPRCRLCGVQTGDRAEALQKEVEALWSAFGWMIPGGYNSPNGYQYICVPWVGQRKISARMMEKIDEAKTLRQQREAKRC